MKPLGLQTVKFFGKTNERLPKGYVMWWENIVSPNKKKHRQFGKKEIIEFFNNPKDY